MQIGNPHTLNAARNALRDQFDALWMSTDTIGLLQVRALRCARALDEPNYRQSGWHRTIFPGGCYTPSGSIVRRKGYAESVIHA